MRIAFVLVAIWAIVSGMLLVTPGDSAKTATCFTKGSWLTSKKWPCTPQEAARLSQEKDPR